MANTSSDCSQKPAPSQEAVVPMSSDSTKTWTTLSTRKGPDLNIFQARFDRVENPRNGVSLDALILEARDWVSVVAQKQNGRVILVEQFRFGSGRVSLETPAGVIEDDEAPLVAAQRELLEETGYTANTWRDLGSVEANPAFMNNTCHLWLAENAVQTGSQSLDAGEDILTVELTEAELKAAIETGRMRNALGLLALARVFDLRPGDWR